MAYPSTREILVRIANCDSEPEGYSQPADCVVPVSRRAQAYTGTIPPRTRKRKAAEVTASSNTGSEAPSNKRVASAVISTEAAAPPVPVTMASNGLDSDEDFMSAATSDEEMQDFSGDDGTLFFDSHNPSIISYK